VWDKNNTNSRNDKRIVRSKSATQWIYSFIEQNKILKRYNKPLFTPTTIMEIDNDKNFAFVIHKAYFNSRGYSVSAADIKAVNWINENAKTDFIVLSNQQVGAASLNQFGFKKY
jgi:hypothetical protein